MLLFCHPHSSYPTMHPISALSTNSVSLLPHSHLLLATTSTISASSSASALKSRRLLCRQLEPPPPPPTLHSNPPNGNQTRNWLSNSSAANRVRPKCHLQSPQSSEPEDQVERSPAEGAEKDEGYISRGALLWRAAKPPIYSVALVPLTVGCSAAYLHTGLFSIKHYLVLLLSSVLIITWLNLSNDVYDFDTGADRDKKESVVNITGSRRVTQNAANASLILGLFGLIWAFKEAGDIRFILFVTCAILCGYVYQCPPFRLSYQGLGEPLCFAAFGPFATTSFYFSSNSQNLPILPLTSTVIAASILVGLTTTLILFCSHFHQIQGDQDVGKSSPLVRLGTAKGSQVVKLGITALYLLLFAFSLCKSLPPSCAILCSLTLPMGNLVSKFVEENHDDKSKIFMAKYYCVRLHALFGAALAMGLFLWRTGTKQRFLPFLFLC